MTCGASPASQNQSVVHPWSPLVGLATMLLALGLLVLSAQPPAPRPLTAPESDFSAARAMEVLERLVGDGAPHPVGSDANAQVGRRIVRELTALGIPVETQTALSCRVVWAVCAEVTNILARLPGQTDGPAVLLTAHYDSVAAGPGAADDMAGVATILEVARILHGEPQRNPVIFLLSDGEELGLLGAEAFVAAHPWASQVGVVVNLEANGTSGQSILFETTENNAWLMDAFIARAPRPVASSLSDDIYALLPFNTDLTVYEEAGIPGINFAFTEEHPRYHTPLDQPANVDPGSVQHHGDNAIAAVRAYAALDLSNPPSGQSVYQEVAPGVVLRWPEPWTIWLALACLALWLGVATAAIRRGELRLRALLWGLPLLPIGVLAATLLGLALGLGVSRLAGAPAPWYAHPLPMRVAIWAGALLCIGLIATALARRAGFRGLFIGVWLWWALLSAIVALLAPAASVQVLIPTALAALAAAAITFAPTHRTARAWEIATIISLFGASWLWLWFSRGSDYSALGPDLGPAVGLAVGMAASTLAPLMALPLAYQRARRWALCGLALLMVVSATISIGVPAYSVARPARLNLLYVQDRQTGEARWALDGSTLPTGEPERAPEALMDAGPFANQPMPILPWSSRAYWTAPAPAMPVTDPTVHVREGARSAIGRVVQLTWPSSNDGHRVSLYIPQDAVLRRLDLVGAPFSMAALPVEDGFQRFHCVAPACNGRVLELHLEGEVAFTAFITETGTRLPNGGEKLIAARGDTAVPSGDGDRSLIIEPIAIAAP